ncbi:hypothetical protein HPB50_019938 [Hyalomma asiaticum]|uniref:Uncharacterized protein n=1 Tax=Hyalomma asiaticum TaxID=266040 RepID=A0ACB7SXJ2_HYAAI|nr:hypothetical protein HPB50_019938 [Hyalomma asiaticum]
MMTMMVLKILELAHSVACPKQLSDIQLTAAPFIFSTKYIQTASGALNLVETCLSVVLFHSLCSHSEESLSEALFMVSFTYSIAGLYLLLNGTCNQPPPPAGSPRQPSTLLTVSVVQACVHLSHALYIYKGDFQRWLDTV